MPMLRRVARDPRMDDPGPGARRYDGRMMTSSEEMLFLLRFS